MGQVVLLGDSIFDNAAYVAGAPDVLRQVRQRLPEGVKATLAAVDGSTMRDVPQQLGRLPEDATHLVLSVGGNDALSSSDFLGAPARSVAEALSGLADIGAGFERGYRSVLAEVLGQGLPTAICTEDGDYANPIEPSARGGEKIARAIAEFVEQGPTGGRTRVFV